MQCVPRKAGGLLALVIDYQVTHPTSWKAIFDPVLKLAGVKTWGTFVKSAKFVEIERDSDGVWFSPTRILGADGGFERIGRHNCSAVGGGCDSTWSGAPTDVRHCGISRYQPERGQCGHSDTSGRQRQCCGSKYPLENKC